MADLPPTLTLTVTVQPGASAATTSINTISSVALGTPILVSGIGREEVVDIVGRKNIRDYGAVDGQTVDSAVTAAVAAAVADGGGIVLFPHTSSADGWNFTYQRPPAGVTFEFDGPNINRARLGGGSTVNFKQAKLGYLDGPHPGTRSSYQNITVVAKGSGQNGIQNGDVAHEIRIDKLNWSNPALAEAGETDGQFIYARQGGPTTGEKSALGGQVIDVGMTKGTGFLCHYEHVSSIFDQDASLAVTHQIDIQAGVLNTRDGDYYGHVMNANVGALDAGILFQNNGSASWGDIVRNNKSGIFNFKISDEGLVTWKQDNTGATTATLKGTGPALEIGNASGNVLVLPVSGTPDGAVTATRGGLALRVNGGPGYTLYVKEDDATSTAWHAVVTASVANSATATGTTQAGAYAIVRRVTIFTTVPSGSGARLNVALRDQTIVINRGANDLLVYPPTGASIDGGATNDPVTVPAGGKSVFVYGSSTTFYSL